MSKFKLDIDTFHEDDKWFAHPTYPTDSPMVTAASEMGAIRALFAKLSVDVRIDMFLDER